jgi:hypothetical protein
MSHSAHNDDQELIREMGSAAATAIGWNGSDRDVRPSRSTSQKEAERIRRRNEGLLNELLDIQPASTWMRGAPKPKPRQDLFPGFWRQGEIAVLIGGPGVGRSILATQIAEQIATGTQAPTGVPAGASPRGVASPALLPGSPPYEGGVASPAIAGDDGVVLSSASTPSSPLSTRHSPLSVVYFDFERTPAQFTERYSAIAANGRRAKYRFARRHQRSFPKGDLATLLRGFGYSREQMLVEALARKAASGRFSTMIVEDLTHLCGVGASANGIRDMLRRFKRWCAGENSALIIADAEPGDLPLFPYPSTSVPPSPFRLPRSDRRASKKLSAILAEADSVFTLNPSTFSPEYRYLKLLKSGSPPYAGFGPTQTLDRFVGPERGVDATPLLPEEGCRRFGDGVVGADDGVVLSTACTIIDPVHVYQLTRSDSPPSLTTDHRPPTTLSAARFLGLQYIGISSEAQHLRDYAAEVAKFQAAIERAVEKEERRRKLSSKESLAEGIIDGSYARYMLNE